MRWGEAKSGQVTTDVTMPNLPKMGELHSWQVVVFNPLFQLLLPPPGQAELPSISSPCALLPHLLCFSCSKGGWKQLLLQGFLQSLEPVWHSPPECLMYKSLLFSWTPNSGYFRKRLWIKAVIYHWDKKIWKLVKTCIQTLIPWKWNCSRSRTENSESCRTNETI